MIVLVLLAVIYLHQLLYWLWYWQIKEYRLDRFKAGFSWQQVLAQFDVRHWWRPKLTTRVILAFLISLVFFSYLAIIIAPVLIGFAMAVSSPPFILWKKILVYKAKNKMKSFKGKVIGVTGSYGKSMTKELIVAMLSPNHKVAKTPKNINSEIGVAQTVLKSVTGDEDYFVVEMGAYKIGEIRRICEIVRPDYGVLTGIGDQHLELFGSQANIKKAKFELIDSLPAKENGLVADRDFSLSDVKEIIVTKDGVEFSYKKQKFHLPLLGKQLVRNVVGVIKLGEKLGIKLLDISENLNNTTGETFLPKKYVGKTGAVIIDNSYNSSLEGFLSALDYLNVWHDYNKIVVTPGFIELGKNAKSDWQTVQAAAKSVGELFLVKPGQKLNLVPDTKTVVLIQGRVPKTIYESF